MNERRCIWCHTPLTEAARYSHVIECSCGVRYDVDAIERSGSEWESIERRDPRWCVKRDGHAVIITDLDAVR